MFAQNKKNQSLYSDKKIQNILKRFVSLFFYLISFFVLTVLIVITFFYLNSEIFNFSETSIFKGKEIYNPYENIGDRRIKANFHAHSKAWGGTTNGKSTEKELFDHYKKNDYDVAGISNYHNISRYGRNKKGIYIPVYEHGFNPLKSHLLIINPQKVSYFDFPLLQTVHHQQTIINKVTNNKTLIAIAHPDFGMSRSLSDFKKLSNYQLTEVLNHYRNSERYWDKALSSGKLSWIVGNDDIHDPKEEEACKIYNVIFADKYNSTSTLDAMRQGKHYSIKTMYGFSENELQNCRIIGENTIRITLTNKADTLLFIGQNGEVRKSLRSTSFANYTMSKNDTYIRVKAINQHSQLFLNPIIRCNNKHLNPLLIQEKVKTNIFFTVCIKTLVGFSLMLLITLNSRILRRIFSKKLRKIRIT